MAHYLGQYRAVVAAGHRQHPEFGHRAPGIDQEWSSVTGGSGRLVGQVGRSPAPTAAAASRYPRRSRLRSAP